MIERGFEDRLQPYVLTVDSVDPCRFDDTTGGWKEPYPLTGSVIVAWTVENRSKQPLTAQVKGFLLGVEGWPDGLPLAASNSCSLDAVPSGSSVHGTLSFYGAQPGDYTLSVRLGRDELTGGGVIVGSTLQHAIVFTILARSDQPYEVAPPQGILWASHPNPTGAFGVCGGKTFQSEGGPGFEWTALSLQTAGVCGTATYDHLSGADVPFSHPFGLLDFEFYVAPDPDPGFLSLLAPNNALNASTDGEFVKAIEQARALGLDVSHGGLGVEMDQGVIPDIQDPTYRFRPLAGDRVAVFGTWIEDCGHGDFHTEIHPPLLMATAHTGTHDNGSPDYERTFAAVISRPYFVTQLYENKDPGNPLQTVQMPLMPHLLAELYWQQVDPFLDIQANVLLADKPFSGDQDMSFSIAPEAPRQLPSDELEVTYHFVVRTGVQVTVDGSAGDSAEVRVTMNEAAYAPPPVPVGTTKALTKAELEKQSRDAADAYTWIQRLEDVLNPIAAYFTSTGVKMQAYDPLTVTLPDPSAPSGVALDDSQPFPVYGWIDIGWKRGGQGQPASERMAFGAARQASAMGPQQRREAMSSSSLEDAPIPPS